MTELNESHFCLILLRQSALASPLAWLRLSGAFSTVLPSLFSHAVLRYRLKISRLLIKHNYNLSLLTRYFVTQRQMYLN